MVFVLGIVMLGDRCFPDAFATAGQAQPADLTR